LKEIHVILAAQKKMLICTYKIKDKVINIHTILSQKKNTYNSLKRQLNSTIKLAHF